MVTERIHVFTHPGLKPARNRMTPVACGERFIFCIDLFHRLPPFPFPSFLCLLIQSLLFRPEDVRQLLPPH